MKYPSTLAINMNMSSPEDSLPHPKASHLHAPLFCSMYGHWFSSMGYYTAAATRIMKIFSQESFSLIIPIATAGTFFVVK